MASCLWPPHRTELQPPSLCPGPTALSTPPPGLLVWNSASEAKSWASLSCHTQHCAWHRFQLHKYLLPLSQLPKLCPLSHIPGPGSKYSQLALLSQGEMGGGRVDGTRKKEVTHPRSPGKGGQRKRESALGCLRTPLTGKQLWPLFITHLFSQAKHVICTATAGP